MKTLLSTDTILDSTPELHRHYLHQLVVVRYSGQQLCHRVSEHVAHLLGVPAEDVIIQATMYDDNSGLDEEHSNIRLPGEIELPLDDGLVLASLTASLTYFSTTHDVCDWALAPVWQDMPATPFTKMTFVIALLRRLPVPITGEELRAVCRASTTVIDAYAFGDTWCRPWSLWRRLLRHTLLHGSPGMVLELIQSSELSKTVRLDLCFALAKEFESWSAETPLLGQCRELVAYLLNNSPLNEYWKRSLRSWARQHQVLLRKRLVN